MNAKLSICAKALLIFCTTFSIQYSGKAQEAVADVSFEYVDQCSPTGTHVKFHIIGTAYAYDGTGINLTWQYDGKYGSTTVYPQNQGPNIPTNFSHSFEDDLPVGNYTFDYSSRFGAVTNKGSRPFSIGPINCANLRALFYVDANNNCLKDSAAAELFPNTSQLFPFIVNSDTVQVLNEFGLKLKKGDRIRTIPITLEQGGITSSYTPKCFTNNIEVTKDTAINLAFTRKDSATVVISQKPATAAIAVICGDTSDVTLSGSGGLEGASGSVNVTVELKFGSYTHTLTVPTQGSGSTKSFTYSYTFKDVKAGNYSGTSTVTVAGIKNDKKAFSVDFGPTKCATVTGNLFQDKNGNCTYEANSDALLTDSLPLFIGNKLVWAGPDFKADIPPTGTVQIIAQSFTVQKGAVYRKYSPNCGSNITANPNSVINISYSYKDSTANTTAIGNVNQEESSFSFYPNPANEELTINVSNTGKNVFISLVDLCGRVQYKSQINEERITIDLSGLNAGVYMIILEDGKSKQSKKLMIR